MEIDADGVMWLDEFEVGAGRPLPKAEIDAARIKAKRERALAKELRAAGRQAKLDAEPTAQQKGAATRKKLNTLRRRVLNAELRGWLRPEQPGRPARPPSAAKLKGRADERKGRAAKQLERDAAREAKVEKQREAARAKRLGVPPLPY